MEVRDLLSMKIFVTGSTGFIGSNFVKKVVSKGHHVLGFKRKGSVPRVSISSSLVDWIEGDLCGLNLKDHPDCDVFVHFASYGVVDGCNDWERCFRHNVFDLLSILKSSIGSSISKYVIIGSCFEYGRSGSRYEYIPVTAPLEPTTAYGSSKCSASLMSSSFAIENGLDLVIARPFHVYGDGEDPRRFYPQLISRSLSGEDLEMTGGDQIRDFQHVDECCDQILRLIDHDGPRSCPRIYNLGSGRPQSLRDFALDQWDKNKSNGKVNFGKIPYRKNEVFRYVPEVNLPFDL